MIPAIGDEDFRVRVWLDVVLDSQFLADRLSQLRQPPGRSITHPITRGLVRSLGNVCRELKNRGRLELEHVDPVLPGFGCKVCSAS